MRMGAATLSTAQTVLNNAQVVIKFNSRENDDFPSSTLSVVIYNDDDVIIDNYR